MYQAIKHLHILCAILSGAGFFLRGLLMLAGSPLLTRRWLRIVPHVNDTILLAAAIALVAMSGQYPFVAPWLTAKVFGLIVYIILGSLSLKAGHGKTQRFVSWLSALLVLAWIASVAQSRHPLGFLSHIAG